MKVLIVIAAAAVLFGTAGVAQAADVTVTVTSDPVAVGAGTVTDENGEISCPGDCLGGYSIFWGVTLHANPSPGWSFGGWSGDCFGDRVRGTTCAFNTGLWGTFNVGATFVNAAPQPPTFITATAFSTTAVRLQWSGATDDQSVSSYHVFRDGSPLLTTALASVDDAVAAGSTHAYFVKAVDVPGLESASSKTVVVTAPATLTVSKDGNGSVTSLPAGIDCGAICNATFAGAATVTLSAVPASGYTFSGWSGACSGTDGCSVAMNANRSVTATFTEVPSREPDKPAPPTTKPDPIPVPVTPTPSAKPPRKPARVPARYGDVSIARITASANASALRATFVFRTLPMRGSRLRAVWYYNNRVAGLAAKRRAPRVSSFVRSNVALPNGWWRCALQVRISGGAWKTVEEARRKLS